MDGKVLFKYRKCGRTGTPWSEVVISCRTEENKIVFDFYGKNAEVSMNFYRKMEDSIKAIDQHYIICDIDILGHQHIEKI